MNLARRIGIVLAAIIAVVLIAVVVLITQQDRLAAKALRHVAELAEKGGHRITFGKVHASIRDAHIAIADLHVVPLADSTLEDSTSRYTVHADRIDLRGVDLEALLRRNVLHVGHIELHGPSVFHSFMAHNRQVPTTDPAAGTSAPSMPLDVLRVDTLRIMDATGGSQDRGKRDPALSIGDLDLLITGIRLVADAQGRPVPDVDGIRIDLHQARTHFAPFYTLTLDSARIRIPQDTALFFGVHFKADVAPKQYHKHVQDQVELYQAFADTLLLAGFDLAERLSTGTLRAREVLAAGVQFDIYRDKTLPPRPIRPKPLLADRIADLQLPMQVDSVFVQRATVTYHERLERDADYGSIAFTHIEGVLTGMGNLAQAAPPDLHLRGTARMGHGRAQVDARMPMKQERSTFQVHVVLTGFPATDMNRMTDDLLHVRATRGTIHRVEMHMLGDNHRASGTITMHYDSLSMELGNKIKHAKLLTKVANLAVRKNNMPGQKGYRTGTFSVEKPVDAGAFKYIWINLRAGMLSVMLPPSLQKQLHKHQEKKALEDVKM